MLCLYGRSEPMPFLHATLIALERLFGPGAALTSNPQGVPSGGDWSGQQPTSFSQPPL